MEMLQKAELTASVHAKVKIPVIPLTVHVRVALASLLTSILSNTTSEK